MLSTLSLKKFGKPSTDLPQVWTLVPEVPTSSEVVSSISALLVGFVDSAVKSLWWRWRELNPRPNIVNLFFYTLRLTSHGIAGAEYRGLLLEPFGGLSYLFKT